MARYSDEERAEAVALLQAEGYPDRVGALTAVTNQLNIPQRTLSRWFNRENNPPPDKLVKEKRRDFSEMFRDEIYAIMGVIPGKRDEAGYRELITAMGIMFDKLRLLDGQSTERVEISLEDAQKNLERRVTRIATGTGKTGVHSESHR